MEYALDRFVMTDNKMLVVQGANSLYTYQHVSGSSVSIQGSNNAVEWVDIGELTPNGTLIKEHSYKYLKSVGAGTVLVNRGEGNNTNDSSDTVNEYGSTALASAWTGTNPSVLALTVTGLLATHKTVLDVDLSSETFANIDGVQAEYALIYRAVPTANTLTLYASKKPTKDLSLKLVVLNG